MYLKWNWLGFVIKKNKNIGFVCTDLIVIWLIMMIRGFLLGAIQHSFLTTGFVFTPGLGRFPSCLRPFSVTLREFIDGFICSYKCNMHCLARKCTKQWTPGETVINEPWNQSSKKSPVTRRYTTKNQLCTFLLLNIETALKPKTIWRQLEIHVNRTLSITHNE